MDLASFLTSLGTSFLIFVALMLLFSWLSRKPGNTVIYYPNRILRGLDPWEGGSMTRNPFAWIKEALSSTEQEVISMSGVDTAVYFVFLSTVLGILVLSSLVLLPILLPVAATEVGQKLTNATISNGTFSDLDKLSMGHLKEKSPRLWAFLLGVYWVSFVTYFLLWKAYKHASNLRATALMSPQAKPEQFAILVRDIPNSLEGQIRKEQVDSYFKTVYPDTFYRSLVVTDNKEVDKIWEEGEIVEPLPSYGRGIDFPGWRYRSLINGDNLTDVMITGDNGTIDGQGFVWWEQFSYHALNYSRPHLVEFTRCENVTVSNLTLLNSPAWHIHPTYCRNVQVLNITLHASPASPYTNGIVPDSSEHVCIENCNISMGHDAIVLKSGWDEYGIAFGKPTKNVHIRGINLQSSLGSGLAFGSEMSGGISNVRVEQLRLHDSFIGIALKTAMGRGGYMKDIVISNVEMENIRLAIEATGQIGLHPDEKYDPDELPVVKGITFENMVGTNVTLAGNFSGLENSPFTSICLSNISFTLTWNSSTSWFCSNVIGFSQEVSPKPCSNLRDSAFNSSSACFFPLYNYASVL